MNNPYDTSEPTGMEKSLRQLTEKVREGERRQVVRFLNHLAREADRRGLPMVSAHCVELATRVESGEHTDYAPVEPALQMESYRPPSGEQAGMRQG